VSSVPPLVSMSALLPPMVTTGGSDRDLANLAEALA